MQQMTITTKELGKLIEEAWPQPADDWYIKESDTDLWEAVFIDGDNTRPFNPEQVVRLEDFWATLAHCGLLPGREPIYLDLLKLMKKKLKQRDTVQVIFCVSRDKEQALKDAAKAIGAKLATPDGNQ